MEDKSPEVCDFCYGKSLLQATGNNGELVKVSCPRCEPAPPPLMYVAIYKKDLDKVGQV